MTQSRFFTIRLIPVVLAGLLSAAAPLSYAEPWTGTLKGGGEVSVDPYTNRTMIQRGGVETQLWDGVHQLEDGSTITVRSGQVVPNADILDSRRQPDMPEVSDRPHADMWIGSPIVGESPCERLVRRVCGDNLACLDRESCTASQQLLGFENEERSAGNTPNRMTRASGQCQEADRDRRFFTSCTP